MTTRTTAATTTTTTTTTTTNQLLVHLVVNEVNRVVIFRIAGTSGSSLKPALILSIHRSVYHAIPARDEDRLVERKRKVFNYVPMTWPCTKVMDLAPRWWTDSSLTENLIGASSDWNLNSHLPGGKRNVSFFQHQPRDWHALLLDEDMPISSPCS